MFYFQQRSYIITKLSSAKYKYEQLGSYGVANKASAPGKPDFVKVTLQLQSGLIAANVKFITSKGMDYAATLRTDGSYEVQLVGAPGGDAQELYALYPKGDGKYWSLGKLFIPSYKAQQKKLILIPVNGATTDPMAIRDKLTDIYKPINISWEVVSADNFNNTSWDLIVDQGKLQVEGSGMLTTLTQEMKALNNAYERTHLLEKTTTYLFVLNQASNTSVQGMMPRSKQFGYLFLNGGSDRNHIPRTAAHELGHGCFTLSHTFDHFATTELSTNLMNDNGGITLSKYQWDIIHEPGVVIDAFESDRSAMSYWITLKDDFLNQDRATFSFLTYTGQIITIPKEGLQDVLFHYGITDIDNIETPMSVLQGFRVRQSTGIVTYSADPTLKKYVDEQGNEYANATTPLNQITGFIYPLPTADKYVLYHFPIGNRTLWVSGQGAVQTQTNLGLLVFEGQGALQPIAKNGQIVKQDISQTVLNNCLWCMTSQTVDMTSGHKEKATLIHIAKIAQIRAAFPEYFENFTSTISWQNPERQQTGVTSERSRSPVPTYRERDSWEWGRYLDLISNASLKEDYSNSRNLYNFYETMYNQLVTYVRNQAEVSRTFWINASETTTPQQFVTHLKTEPFVRSKLIPYDKRMIALKTLFTSNIVYNDDPVGVQEADAFTKLIASVSDDLKEKFVKKIASDIGFETVFAKLSAGTDDTRRARLLLLLISYIEDIVPYYQSYCDALDHKDAEPIATINSRLISYVNANNYRFDGEYIEFREPSVLIMDETNTSSSPSNKKLYVKYYQSIAVKFTSEFTWGDLTFKNGDVAIMPAVQAALLCERGTQVQLNTAAWLAVDGLCLALGAGEIKILVHGASYLRTLTVAGRRVENFRRSLAFANVSSLGLQTSSHLLEGVVTEPTIKKLELLSMVLAVGGGVPTMMFDGLVALEAKCMQEQTGLTNAIAAEPQNSLNPKRLSAKTALEAERNQIRVLMGSNQEVTVNLVDDVAVIFGEYSDEFKEFVAAIPKEQGVLNVVIHAQGNSIFININGVNYICDIKDFANILNQLRKQGKQFDKIRLVSCGSELSGQELSRQLKCKVEVCEGKVNLFSSGKIKSAENKPWKVFNNGDNGTVVPEPTASLGETNKFVTLSTNPVSDFRIRLTEGRFSQILSKFDNNTVFNETLRKIFSQDFNNVNNRTLQLLENNPRLVNIWVSFADKPWLKGEMRDRYIRDLAFRNTQQLDVMEYMLYLRQKLSNILGGNIGELPTQNIAAIKISYNLPNGSRKEMELLSISGNSTMDALYQQFGGRTVDNQIWSPSVLNPTELPYVLVSRGPRSRFFPPLKPTTDIPWNAQAQDAEAKAIEYIMEVVAKDKGMRNYQGNNMRRFSLIPSIWENTDLKIELTTEMSPCGSCFNIISEYNGVRPHSLLGVNLAPPNEIIVKHGIFYEKRIQH